MGNVEDGDNREHIELAPVPDERGAHDDRAQVGGRSVELRLNLRVRVGVGVRAKVTVRVTVRVQPRVRVGVRVRVRVRVRGLRLYRTLGRQIALEPIWRGVLDLARVLGYWG